MGQGGNWTLGCGGDWEWDNLYCTEWNEHLPFSLLLPCPNFLNLYLPFSSSICFLFFSFAPFSFLSSTFYSTSLILLGLIPFLFPLFSSFFSLFSCLHSPILLFCFSFSIAPSFSVLFPISFLSPIPLPVLTPAGSALLLFHSSWSLPSSLFHLSPTLLFSFPLFLPFPSLSAFPLFFVIFLLSLLVPNFLIPCLSSS